MWGPQSAGPPPPCPSTGASWLLDLVFRTVGTQASWTGITSMPSWHADAQLLPAANRAHIAFPLSINPTIPRSWHFLPGNSRSQHDCQASKMVLARPPPHSRPKKNKISGLNQS